MRLWCNVVVLQLDNVWSNHNRYYCIKHLIYKKVNGMKVRTGYTLSILFRQHANLLVIFSMALATISSASSCNIAELPSMCSSCISSRSASWCIAACIVSVAWLQIVLVWAIHVNVSGMCIPWSGVYLSCRSWSALWGGTYTVLSRCCNMF